MRILSKVFFWLGLAAVIAAVLYFIFGGILSVYDPYLSLPADLVNPLYRALLDALVLLLGGFFIGLGIGMIRRKKRPEKEKEHAHAHPAEPAEE